MNLLIFSKKAIKPDAVLSENGTDPVVEIVVFKDMTYENLLLEKKYVRKIKFYCDEQVSYFFINRIPFEVKDNNLDFNDYMICSQYLGMCTLKIEFGIYSSTNSVTVGFY
jgi:hypothetical protein